ALLQGRDLSRTVLHSDLPSSSSCGSGFSRELLPLTFHIGKSSRLKPLPGGMPHQEGSIAAAAATTGNRIRATKRPPSTPASIRPRLPVIASTRSRADANPTACPLALPGE